MGAILGRVGMDRYLWVAVAFVALGIANCQSKKPDPVEAVKVALKANLKDPSSVQFRNVRLINNVIVCGEYNGKNSFGGYVGFEPFYGRITDSGEVTAYSAAANPHGSNFAKVLNEACRDTSGMSLEERDTDLDRRLKENGEWLNQVRERS